MMMLLVSLAYSTETARDVAIALLERKPETR
jgi:hypothetical protein